MFLVIVSAAHDAKSSALLADSLDNFGDALTYGLSLYAVSRGAAIKARVVLFKVALILRAAIAVNASCSNLIQQAKETQTNQLLIKMSDVMI